MRPAYSINGLSLLPKLAVWRDNAVSDNKKLLIYTGTEWLVEVDMRTFSREKIYRNGELFIILKQQAQAGYYQAVRIKINSTFLCSQSTSTVVVQHSVSIGRPVLFKAKRLLELTNPLGRGQLSFSTNKVSIYNNRWWPAAFVRLWGFFYISDFSVEKSERRAAKRQQGFLHVLIYC